MRIPCATKWITLLSMIIGNCSLLCQSALLNWLKQSEILHLYPGELIFSPGCPKSFGTCWCFSCLSRKWMSWWGLIRGTICCSLVDWLGWKLVVFLDGTGRWTILWYQCFSHSHLIRPQQLNFFGKAFSSLSEFTARPELAHLLQSGKMSPNATVISLQVFPLSLSNSAISLMTRKQNFMEVALVTHLNHRRQIWLLWFTSGALKQDALSVQPL